MELFYNLLGRVLFPRRQEWRQRRSAKTLVLTIGFSMMLGLVLAGALWIMYYHRK